MSEPVNLIVAGGLSYMLMDVVAVGEPQRWAFWWVGFFVLGGLFNIESKVRQIRDELRKAKP